LELLNQRPKGLAMTSMKNRAIALHRCNMA
jgi:hypothetical protein